MKINPMENVKVVLCSHCSECPAVEITGEVVTIGEDDNTVRLTHAQWNDLVSRIRSGELSIVE
jgi:hypothetical protein